MKRTLFLLAALSSMVLHAQLDVPVPLRFVGDGPDRRVGGLADPVSLNDGLSVDAARATTTSRAIVSGTTTLVGQLAPAPVGLVAGMTVTITTVSANHAGATLDLNGLGARPILKWGALPLDSADLAPQVPARVVFDGMNFLLLDNNYRTCPTGYTAASATTCIGNSPVGSNNFHGAAQDCHALGARLCRFEEWYSACRNNTAFITTVTANEWVDDGANSAAEAKVMGTGSDGVVGVTTFSCRYGYSYPFSTTQAYRCCISR